MSRRMLVAYSASSTYVQTTADYLRALSEHLGYDVDYIHVTHGAEIGVDVSAYDILFHNYCARLIVEGYISESYLAQIKRFRGLKILSVQDEYENTNLLRAVIRDLKFDIVLTCVPQESLEYVYPRAMFPNVKFVTALTGYAPDSLPEVVSPPKPLATRPIVLGYRGRDIGGLYGNLAYQKYEIGRKMKEVCDRHGLLADIAMDETSRIYGHAWLEFIGNCRAMLGSESGSNVFDFDGSLRRKYQEMTSANGRQPSYEQFRPYVANRESEIDMGQISPRIFECAAMRTPMVLLRGRYSEVISPDEHYIALEKDYSNADEVLYRLSDLEGLQAMADRAYRHLVESGKFGYRAFCQRLRKIIETELSLREPPVAVLDSGTNSSHRILDRYSAVSTEFATKTPADAEQMQKRVLRRTFIQWESKQLNYISVCRKRHRQWSYALEAHIRLIDRITSETGVELICKQKASILSEYSNHLEIADSNVHSNFEENLDRIDQIDWFSNNSEYLALEDAIASDRANLLREYMEFFTDKYWKLIELNHELLTDIRGRLAVDAVKRVRWTLVAYKALLKAPPWATVVAAVQRVPAIHRAAKRARAMILRMSAARATSRA